MYQFSSEVEETGKMVKSLGGGGSLDIPVHAGC